MTITEKLKKVKQKLTGSGHSSDQDVDIEKGRIGVGSSDDESTTSGHSNKSSDDELLSDDGKNFGKTKLLETNKPATWNLLIRVIEAKDVASGSVRVRTIFDGKSKMTRTVTHAVPKWRQNILYTVKDEPLEKLAAMALTLRLVRPTTLGETNFGEFSCYLSEVIHSSPDRSVISKWVALGVIGEEEENEDHAYENCGFLKVSICVYRIDETPPQLIDDIGMEQIWNGAHLIDYTLKVRFFSVEQLIRSIINESKPQKFYVRIECGDHKAQTTFEETWLDKESETGSVKFMQEIYLPIQWPTVISQITFSLFAEKHNKINRKKWVCIGKATIPMKKIYEPGEEGYLPHFGPAYLNFFDFETDTRFSFFTKKNKRLQQDGSKFVGRLLVALSCVELMGESTVLRKHLDHSTKLDVDKFSKNSQQYNAFCSINALNMISAQFASDPISIFMSIGPFGSLNSQKVYCSSSTVAVQPDTDDCKSFVMPWGNFRPITEVDGIFENIDKRIEMSNVLMKTANMLDRMIYEVRRIGNGAIDHQASVGMEALETLEQMIQSASSFLSRIQLSMSNDLDRNLLENRKRKLRNLNKYFESESLEKYSDKEVEAKLLRMLLHLKSLMTELAEDVQISLPPVLIKMMSYGKLIGFAKIPISEIFQSEDEVQSGEWCGRTRQIKIQLPTLLGQRIREKEFVAVLHAKMWFGRNEKMSKWEEYVEPAEMRHFIEVYEKEKKNIITSKWNLSESKLFNSNDDRIDGPLEAPEGWKATGTWVLMNVQNTFVTELSHETMNDKAYEVQKRVEGNEWKRIHFSDQFGNKFSDDDFKKMEKGCDSYDHWKPDKFRNNGDEEGWIYSINGAFNGNMGALDGEAKDHHKFRRRCLKKLKKKHNKEMENFSSFRASLNDEKWEYATKSNGAYHVAENGDKYRRRRYIRQVERRKKLDSNDLDNIPTSLRLYEFQVETVFWQLRCYFMWANDLLPVVKNSSNVLIRVSFGHKTQETLVVDNSQNPIWNETITFPSVLIGGGIRDISKYPPVVSVSVVGECMNNEELDLGRFETTPVVICSTTDPRGTPRWYPLCFPNQQTRGNVLASFEMFLEEDKDLIPLEPELKHNMNERRTIPSDFQPQLDRYHIQFLCWGVRNLKKYNLLAVRRPYIELMIGDQEFTLEPLKDVRQDPNFPEQMIIFSEVLLPSALELSPPFVINLFDSRSFNRKPLVGSCFISDLRKYMTSFHAKSKADHSRKWEKLNYMVKKENEKVLSMVRIPILSTDPMVPLDWWSRYYSSMSQFHRSPGYPESGMEYIRVFNRPLEEMNGYNNFTDFLETFPFVKSIKGNFDNPEEKEIAGELKGRLLISKLKDKKAPPEINPVVDFTEPTKCIVRVYIIEATGLISNARKGRIDSYVKLKCGSQKVNLKNNYRSECCDPCYGERVDMTVTIPLEKDLKITVMDKRRILSDQEIGSTVIDLENRLLSKWRAICGLSAQYTVHGEQQWRDQKTPMEILTSYCYKMQLTPPIIKSRCREAAGDEKGIIVEGIEFWFSDVLLALEKEETSMLSKQRQQAGKEATNRESGGTGEDVESWNEMEMETKEERLKWEQKRSVLEKKPKKKEEETADGQKRRTAKRRIMGTQLETIALFILRTMNLVPEHVESRTLYSDKSVETGKLRMFVDIFPLECGQIPAPFNITPRKPIHYQLRVAVMDVRGAIPVKRSFAEPVSDLYVKMFINGMTKGHKTDTHFRVLDGCGEFNWRFLLNFDYNPWEKKVVAYTKTRMFRKPVEELVDPILVVELWDKNKFRKDRLLGEIELDLLDFIEGIGSPSDVGIYSSKKRSNGIKCPKCCTSRGCLCKCCIFCYETKCLCGRRKVKKKAFPKPKVFVEPEGYEDTVNLFEARNVYGWWPMLTYLYPHEEPQDARKKEDDVGKDPRWIMGLVEMDMSLLTQKEAEQEPVGKKRDEPNHSPFLEKPERKSWANSWLVSRIKPCLKYFWHYFGLQILLWLLIILLIGLTIFALIQTWPIIFMEIMKSIF